VLFRDELPTEDELPALYEADYFESAAGELGAQGYSDYLGDGPSHRATARSRLRQLARYTTPGRLLDVGCAAGFFADEARRAGWEAEGVELSPAMAAHAAELGVPVRQGSFCEVPLPEPGLAAVTMWDYIEHSTDPVRDLRIAAGLLRPGGVLALSTGDVTSLVARVSGSRWHLLTPRHHNFFFDPDTIGTALRRAGFDPVAVTHPGGRYSVAYLAHKLGLETVSTWLSERSAVSVPVNLFDIMTVVARKARESERARGQ
jgi:SAM-dependent methyltransferase